LVRVRAADESGFGLIELAFAMVMLNIGILALVATFQQGALSLQRSAKISSATAVADKAMEVYRALQNKAIYLNAPSGGGSDVSGLPNGIPNSTSTWYATYQGDSSAYGGATYYNYTSPSTNSPLWVTQAFTSSSTYSPIPTTSTTSVPSGLAIDPTKAVQRVTGPDGQQYPVYSYVTMVKPQNTSSYGYVKLVTVVVHDPTTITKILARQSSLFDPNVSP
jgi:type II secretory pathway pseudopilin PulG